MYRGQHCWLDRAHTEPPRRARFVATFGRVPLMYMFCVDRFLIFRQVQNAFPNPGLVRPKTAIPRKSSCTWTGVQHKSL